MGNRGFALINEVLLKNNDIEIVSVCDIYEDRIAHGRKNQGGKRRTERLCGL